jgi:hypothetical protein
MQATPFGPHSPHGLCLSHLTFLLLHAIHDLAFLLYGALDDALISGWSQKKPSKKPFVSHRQGITSIPAFKAPITI